MVGIEEIIKDHENKLEELKKKVNDDTEINQKLIFKEKILTEQNYLLEIYKIKSSIGLNIKPIKRAKIQDKKNTKKKNIKKKDIDLIELNIREKNPSNINFFL